MISVEDNEILDSEQEDPSVLQDSPSKEHSPNKSQSDLQQPQEDYTDEFA